MSNSGYCSLIVKGNKLDLDLIEETLNISSSEKHKKGEIFNSIIRSVYKRLHADRETGC